jgi:hypothetical protein
VLASPPLRIRPVKQQARHQLLAAFDKLAECKVLRRENVAVFNPGEAFFQRQELCYFLALSGVAEIGEIKPPTSNVTEVWRSSIRMKQKVRWAWVNSIWNRSKRRDLAILSGYPRGS